MNSGARSHLSEEEIVELKRKEHERKYELGQDVTIAVFAIITHKAQQGKSDKSPTVGDCTPESGRLGKYRNHTQ